MSRISDQNSSLETPPEHQPNALNDVNHFQIVARDNNRLKKRNFAYAFLPIYYFSRIFGLMPFTIIYNSRGEIQAPQVRRFDAFWFGISISIYVLAAFTNFQTSVQTMQLPEKMKIISFALYFGHYMLLIEGLLVGAIAIGLDMYTRHKLVAILKAFIAFDNEVSETTVWNC